MSNTASSAIAGLSSVSKPGPWRITFDTNPDDCNLHCIMCEDHSPYSATQSDRISAGRPKRRMDIDLIRPSPGRLPRNAPARDHTIHYGGASSLPRF